MSHGGKRAGAGRPVTKATLLKQKMREALIERAHREVDALYDAQFALALGHWRVIDDPLTGKPLKVYKKGPNGEALGYLLDQVLDKAIQHVDVEGSVETEDKLSAQTLAEIRQAVKYALPSRTTKDKPRGKDSAPAGK